MAAMPPFAFWKSGIPPVILSGANYDQVRTQGFGAPLRLTGTNFDKGFPIAYVDGVATTGTVIDATHMDVDMPPHAAGANVPVMVDNGGGFAGDPVYVEYWSPLNFASFSPSGWWPSISDTGYTSVSTNGVAGLGTILDMSGNGRDLSSNASPPEGTLQGNVIPATTQATVGGVRYLASAGPTSDFISSNRFTMWALFRCINGGTNTWPEGNPGLSWTQNFIMCSAFDAFGCGLGATGDNFTPVLTGKSQCYIYNGGQAGVSAGGLALDTWYLIVGKFGGGSMTIEVNGTQVANGAVPGTISQLTQPLQIFANPNRTAGIRGDLPDSGIVDGVVSGADLAKLLKYQRQAYGLALT